MGRALVSVTVYYYPGDKQNPFGHIAIGGFENNVLHAPVGYLSYGVGKGKAKDKFQAKNGDEFDISFGTENLAYKGCELIALPPCEKSKFLKAIENFANRNREEYNILTNNCANAVLEFLKTVGFVEQTKSFISPVRPQAIALESFDIVLASIKENRQKIVDEPSNYPLKKIKELLDNDIERLRIQLQRDKAAHLSWIKTPRNKTNKIAVLIKIRQKIMDSNLVMKTKSELSQHVIDLQECLKAFLAARDLGTKTKINLAQCIDVFQEFIPLNIIKANEKKDKEYFKRERESILDDETDDSEKIQKLLENDIEHLEFRGKEKSVDANVLKELASLFKMGPGGDYLAFLDIVHDSVVINTVSDITKKSFKEYIQHFPYDKIPQIKEMQKFLIVLDVILNSKSESKDHRLFSSSPKPISAMRAKVPVGIDAICAMDEKSVYEAFRHVTTILANAQNQVGAPALEQDFYKIYHEMAVNVLINSSSDLTRVRSRS